MLLPTFLPLCINFPSLTPPAFRRTKGTKVVIKSHEFSQAHSVTRGTRLPAAEPAQPLVLPMQPQHRPAQGWNHRSSAEGALGYSRNIHQPFPNIPPAVQALDGGMHPGKCGGCWAFLVELVLKGEPQCQRALRKETFTAHCNSLVSSGLRFLLISPPFLLQIPLLFP